ncbi:flagellar hook-associated protein FlgL [Thermovenabulum gondwanense]|uniref:Flagellar hook-associated protein 3 n=1 Tax=Thermovenabulum gondwanense TaxID=520767 RepID=A0A162M5H7_9FIRM|nr:flagellar hook-associated protein FlgL [Thermovenabulum gondwanense]KYO64119.1 Flagellar hook-associated protein 3 [Thermovenabulum gondwanense]
MILRVTQGMITEAFMRNLSYNLKRLGEKEDQLSSGKKVRLPSDDPVSAVLAMRLRNTLLSLEQYSKNVDDAVTWLQNTETALQNTGEILQRIRELTVYGSNGTLTASDRAAILDEITQLKEQILQEANSSYNNRYLFGGYYTDTQPFSYDTSGKIVANTAFDLPSKVTVVSDGGTGIKSSAVDLSKLGSGISAGNYKIIVTNFNDTAKTADVEIQDDSGNAIARAVGISVNQDNQRIYEVDGSGNPDSTKDFVLNLKNFNIISNGTAQVTISKEKAKSYNLGRLNTMDVSLYGDEVFGEIFKVVEEIEDALKNDNPQSLSSKLSDLDNAINTLLKFRSQVGAKINRLEATRTRIENNKIDYTSLLSNTEDVDIAKVIMELKMEENVYRASLAVGARVIQPSLVDFLR